MHRRGGRLSVGLSQDVLRKIADNGGNVPKELLRCSYMFISAEARRAQLLGEFSSSSSTTIDVEQLEQVDDRGPPVEPLRVLGRQLLEVSCDIDHRDRRLR